MNVERIDNADGTIHLILRDVPIEDSLIATKIKLFKLKNILNEMIVIPTFNYLNNDNSILVKTANPVENGRYLIRHADKGNVNYHYYFEVNRPVVEDKPIWDRWTFSDGIVYEEDFVPQIYRSYSDCGIEVNKEMFDKITEKYAIYKEGSEVSDIQVEPKDFIISEDNDVNYIEFEIKIPR